MYRRSFCEVALVNTDSKLSKLLYQSQSTVQISVGIVCTLVMKKTLQRTTAPRYFPSKSWCFSFRAPAVEWHLWLSWGNKGDGSGSAGLAKVSQMSLCDRTDSCNGVQDWWAWAGLKSLWLEYTLTDGRAGSVSVVPRREHL